MATIMQRGPAQPLGARRLRMSVCVPDITRPGQKEEKWGANMQPGDSHHLRLSARRLSRTLTGWQAAALHGPRIHTNFSTFIDRITFTQSYSREYTGPKTPSCRGRHCERTLCYPRHDKRYYRQAWLRNMALCCGPRGGRRSQGP